MKYEILRQKLKQAVKEAGLVWKPEKLFPDMDKWDKEDYLDAIALLGSWKDILRLFEDLSQLPDELNLEEGNERL